MSIQEHYNSTIKHLREEIDALKKELENQCFMHSETIEELKKENEWLKQQLDKWIAEHDPAILKLRKEILAYEKRCDNYDATVGQGTKRIKDLERENERYKEALEKIRCRSDLQMNGFLSDGDMVKIAEQALEGEIPEENKKMGCNHPGPICEA